MNVCGYGPRLDHAVFVPSFAVLEDGTCILRDRQRSCPAVHDTWSRDTSFSLDDGKWFAVDHGNVVRFPLEKEWEWRTRRARELVTAVAGAPLGADRKIHMLECAARLVNLDLEELVRRVNKASSDGTGLDEALKSVLNATPSAPAGPNPAGADPFR